MKKCDICGKEDYYLVSIKLPTRCRRWVKDAYGTMIMPVYNGIEFLDTTICQSCIDGLASILLEVTVDE